MFTRRDFGRLAASGLLASTLPSPAWASRADERRFLFVFCSGGWDTTLCFTPVGPNSIADVEPDHAASTVNGIRFTDVASRPKVRQFFESWGHQACVINGLEVQSVTHERCRQIILTGQADVDSDDWPSLIAGGTANELVLPHIVMDGPAFNSRLASRVVRVGDTGQLPDLLGGEALLGSGAQVPPSSIEALEDAYVRQRVAALQSTATAGPRARFLSDYGTALADYEALLAQASDVNLGVSMRGCERDVVADASTVFDCFELGLARCGMIRYNGWCSESWDQHQGIEMQSTNYNDLFEYLGNILFDLSLRTSPSGAPLSDEVTVVVFSEMGRAPQLNTWGGKDHWTFTSTMLLGSGILGGQVLGELDDSLRARCLDLSSGAVNDTATKLLPEHLGATLLHLADIDPGEHIAEPAPILAALSRP